jgi:hypothetical protein
VLAGKHVGELKHQGAIVKMAPQMAEITAEILPSQLANMRLSLYDPDDRAITDDLYAKVVAHLSEAPPVFHVNFTSIPPEASTFLAELPDSLLTD